MNKKNVKKIVLTILIVIVAGFHIIWLLNEFVKYGKYTKAVGLNEDIQEYYLSEGDTSYSVERPVYPSFKGTLSIVSTPEGEYDEMLCCMFIYPEGINGYKCCFNFANVLTEGESNIWFNEDFEVIEEDNEGDFEKYEEYIKDMCKLAYEKWGILEYE